MSGRKVKFLKGQTPRKLDSIISSMWSNKTTEMEDISLSSTAQSTESDQGRVALLESACRRIFDDTAINNCDLRQTGDSVDVLQVDNEMSTVVERPTVETVAVTPFKAAAQCSEAADSGTGNVSVSSEDNSLNSLSQQLSLLNNDSTQLVTPLYKRVTPNKRTAKSQTIRQTPSKRVVAVDSPVNRLEGLFIDYNSPTLNTNSSHAVNSSTPHTGTNVRIKRRLINSSDINSESVLSNDGIETNLSETNWCLATPKKGGKYGSIPSSAEKKTPSRGDKTASSNVSKRKKSKSTDTDSSVAGFRDRELDTMLEKKADEIKLTAKNVKSLLLRVITDENVMDMVRNSLLEDGLSDQLKEAIFEPKMTRSKVKEAMKEGNVPAWMSPAKLALQPPAQSEVKQFLDETFADSDDDEEYHPNPNEENEETDDESLLSPWESDRDSAAGTPQPPSSARSLSIADDADSPYTAVDTPTSSGFKVPHNPPWLATTPRSVGHEEMIIARRTRSKFPLTDTDIDDLEAMLCAPDVTPDLYSPVSVRDTLEDPVWDEFLSGLTKKNSGNHSVGDANDEEANDPEFNFLEALAEVELDAEDFRNDKAVRITKKELDALMEGFYEEFADDDLEADTSVTAADASAASPSTPSQPTTPPSDKGGEASTTSSGKTVPNSTTGEMSSRASCSTVTASSSLVDRRDTGVVLCNDAPSGAGDTVNESGMAAMDTSATLLASVIGEANAVKNVPTHDDEDTSSMSESEGDVTIVNDVDAGSSSSPQEIVITSEQMTLIELQMAKYVQLLAQTFVLAGISDKFNLVTRSTCQYLNELKVLGNDGVKKAVSEGAAEGTVRSTFHPPNLQPALDLVQHHAYLRHMGSCADITKKTTRRGENHAPPLLIAQMDLFATSRAFIFPAMLPPAQFLRVRSDSSRVIFTPAEESLFVLGLSEFETQKYKYEHVSKYLMPAKSPRQLISRLRNNRARASKDNAIVRYLNGHHLPTSKQSDVLPSGELVPLCQRKNLPAHEKPPWWETYEQYLSKKTEDAATALLPGRQKQKRRTGSDQDTPPMQHILMPTSFGSPSQLCLVPVHVIMPHTAPVQSSPFLSASTAPADNGRTVTVVRASSSTPQSFISNTTFPSSSSAGLLKEAMRVAFETDNTLDDNNDVNLEGASTSVETTELVTAGGSAASGRGVSHTTPVTSRNSSSGSKQSASGKGGISKSKAKASRSNTKTANSQAIVEVGQLMDLIEANVTASPSRSGQLVLRSVPASDNNCWAEPCDNSDLLDQVELRLSETGQRMSAAIRTTVGETVVSTSTNVSNGSISTSTPCVNVVASSAVVECGDTNATRHNVVASLTASDTLHQLSSIVDTRVEDSIQPNSNTNDASKASRKRRRQMLDENEQLLMKCETIEDPARESASSPSLESESEDMVNDQPTSDSCLADFAANCSQPVDGNSVVALKLVHVFHELSGDSSQANSSVMVVKEGTSDASGYCHQDEGGRENIEPASHSSTVSWRHDGDVMHIKHENEQQKRRHRQRMSRRLRILVSLADDSLVQLDGTIVRGSETDDSDNATATSSRQLDLCAELGFDQTPVKSGPTTGRSAGENTSDIDLSVVCQLEPPSPMCSPDKDSPRGCVVSSTNEGGNAWLTSSLTTPVKSDLSPRTPPSKRSRLYEFSREPIAIAPAPGGIKDSAAPVSPHLPKVKRSPRRKLVSTRLRPLLPKGTVAVSPLKLAAASVSARARKQRTKAVVSSPARLILPKGVTSSSPIVPAVRSLCGEFSGAERQHRRGEDVDCRLACPPDEDVVKEPQKRSKAMHERERLDAVLNPNLVDSDPLRDERDTELAQWYLNKVKDALQGDTEKYEQFLQLLVEVDRAGKSPVTLYKQLQVIFEDHEELLNDFAPFLLPEQATQVGCLMGVIEHNTAHSLLCKLQAYFAHNPSHLQKILRELVKFEQSGGEDVGQLRDTVLPLLKGNQVLEREFLLLFASEPPPPDSYSAETFEEVDLSDPENDSLYDGFETVKPCVVNDSSEANKSDKKKPAMKKQRQRKLRLKSASTSAAANSASDSAANKNDDETTQSVAVTANSKGVTSSASVGVTSIASVGAFSAVSMNETSTVSRGDAISASVGDASTASVGDASSASRSDSVSLTNDAANVGVSKMTPAWSREQDRFLLEYGQTKGYSEAGVREIARTLAVFSVDQVMDRIEHLVARLSANASDKN